MIILNEWNLQTGRFPNNESWVNIKDQIDMKEVNNVFLHFESNDDLINLMCVKRWLDELGKKARLYIEYFPYSRMDRRNVNYAFSLKYVCEFINSLHFMKVVISEPHSDVVSALLDNCVVYNFIEDRLSDVLKHVEFNEEKDLLFYPDAGAVKRYSSKLKLPYCYANKERDFKTGDIIKYDIVSTSPVNADMIVIVDDLCSRGGTFLQAANAIHEKLSPNIKVYLMIAHCENNIFTGELLKDTSPIEHIFCSNSLLTNEHEKITIVK